MDYQSYLSHNVAVNLKRIRTSKGMSLDVLSEQTGVSKSMLAQIEKGTANPSLGVLGKITSGLRIEFQELIDAPPMESCLVTPDQMTPTKEMIGEYKVWTCFPYEDNHQLEIYRIDIEPGGKYISGSHGEKTREYLSVTDGELTIECGEDVQKITKGEIYRFETDKKHNYKNETPFCRMFACCKYPSGMGTIRPYPCYPHRRPWSFPLRQRGLYSNLSVGHRPLGRSDACSRLVSGSRSSAERKSGIGCRTAFSHYQ